MLNRLAWSVCCTLALLACADGDTVVEFHRSGDYRFTNAERRAVQRVAEHAVSDARTLLPSLISPVVLRVYPGDDVSDVTGASGTVSSPQVVIWVVDPNRSGGVEATVAAHLRTTLFHELHHLVRYPSAPTFTLMDRVVFEGMASVFERDYAGATYPWTRYPDEVADWADELLALPRDTPSDEWRQWMFAHDDGRRWIGYRAGTYMTDQVAAATGRSVMDLATLGTDEFIQVFIEARGNR